MEKGWRVTFAFRETCDFVELVSGEIGEISAVVSVSPQRMAMVWYSPKKKRRG
jgi:hypothetical protein